VKAVLRHLAQVDTIELFKGAKYPMPMMFPDAFAEAMEYIAAQIGETL
jgi:hypothetical protein